LHTTRTEPTGTVARPALARQTNALARRGGLIDAWLMAQVIAFAEADDIRDV